MKYIDADKLIAEIEKKRKTLISEYNELAKYEVWRSANDNKIKIYTISDILSLINSLQQEQPEVDFEKFDKEATKIWGKCSADPNDSIACFHLETFNEIARHFYELGLNARKEE